MSPQERAALVALGLRMASRLGIKVGGRDVPAAVIEALPGQEPEPDALPALLPLIQEGHGIEWEAARRIAIAIRLAEQELKSTGDALGLIRAPDPAPVPTILADVPAPPEPPEPSIERRDGAVIVAGAYEVRSSDGRSWHVTDVRAERQQLLSWHPNEAAALDWVIALIKTGGLSVGRPPHRPLSGEHK